MTTELVVAADWPTQITAAWRKSTEAIFETGRLIIEAKAALPHGEFAAMIETQLPFGERTAQRLMAIAGDVRLSNPTRVSHLPPSWGTLYALTQLDDETLEAQFAGGTIRPDMERQEVLDLRSGTGPVNGARAIMGSRQEPGDSLDYFPTPPWATRALCEDVLPHLGISLSKATVWEPACGEGHMSGVLEEFALHVTATDIFDYSRDGRSAPGWQGVYNFLGEGPAPVKAKWIISNPPFEELALLFALRALDLAGRGVAMFVQTRWLEGIDRYTRLYRDRPPTLFGQFVERVNLCKGRWEPDGTTATAYCWLVWVADVPAQPVFWIPPGRRVARSKPRDVERFTAQPVLGIHSRFTGIASPGGLVTRPDHQVVTSGEGKGVPPAATFSSGRSSREEARNSPAEITDAPGEPAIAEPVLDTPPAPRPELSGWSSREGARDSPVTRSEAEPILRAHYATRSGAELSAMLGGVPIGTIRTWAFHFGLTSKQRIRESGLAWSEKINAGVEA